MKFKRCVYKYRQLINSSIRNTEQHQLLKQFLHEGNHSALIEILLCDLAKKVVQQQKWSSILIKFLFAPRIEDNFLSMSCLKNP